MGVWNETCAITGVPIAPNEDVVMVVFRRDFDWRGESSFMGTIWGDVERVAMGEYDYYGGIDDHEHAKEGQPRFFVKKIAWTWCQEQSWASKLDGYLKKDDAGAQTVASAKELLAVFQTLSRIRRSPFSAWHAIGGQTFEEELDAMAAVLDLSSNTLKAFRDDWES